MVCYPQYGILPRPLPRRGFHRITLNLNLNRINRRVLSSDRIGHWKTYKIWSTFPHLLQRLPAVFLDSISAALAGGNGKTRTNDRSDGRRQLTIRFSLGFPSRLSGLSLIAQRSALIPDIGQSSKIFLGLVCLTLNMELHGSQSVAANQKLVHQLANLQVHILSFPSAFSLAAPTSRSGSAKATTAHRQAENRGFTSLSSSVLSLLPDPKSSSSSSTTSFFLCF